MRAPDGAGRTAPALSSLTAMCDSAIGWHRERRATKEALTEVSRRRRSSRHRPKPDSARQRISCVAKGSAAIALQFGVGTHGPTTEVLARLNARHHPSDAWRAWSWMWKAVSIVSSGVGEVTSAVPADIASRTAVSEPSANGG
jgi:hypothetical protein